MEYIAKAWSVWLLGFVPFAEIYVAVPAGLALGLDPVSTVFWSVAGNFAPVPLLHFGYERLARIPRAAVWLDRLASEDRRRRLERSGFWFVAVLTPWIGVWVVAASARALGLPGRALLASTLLGIAVYAVAVAAVIMAGVSLFS
jgi:uncharacterized membrane protein